MATPDHDPAQPSVSTQLLFGRNLRRIRSARHLSQEELAEQADLSASFISELELARKWLSAEVLDRLAQALGVPVHELFLPNPGDGGSEYTDVLRSFIERFDQQVREGMDDVLRNALSSYLGDAGQEQPADDQPPDTDSSPDSPPPDSPSPDSPPPDGSSD